MGAAVRSEVSEAGGGSTSGRNIVVVGAGRANGSGGAGDVTAAEL